MKKSLIVGSGPAGLMAAYELAKAGFAVEIFEKRSGPGRKLLIAGSSGLNISYDAPLDSFPDFYRNRKKELRKCFDKFGREEWLQFLTELKIPYFLGTSKRYFVEDMKAASLLHAWIEKLRELGVQFSYDKEFSDFRKDRDGFQLEFRDGSSSRGDCLLFALGGGSYEKEIPSWVNIFREHKIPMQELVASNAGYHLAASADFFQAAEGKAIKGVLLRTALGEKLGEMMITRYGLEGTPVYTVGCVGPAFLDLKPDLTVEKFAQRLREGKGNVWEIIEQRAKLSPGALLLAKHLAPEGAWDTVENTAQLLKNFPVQLTKSRPMEETISTAGGISWDALTENLESKENQGVFFAGEMVDWDAPTGGFLLTACVSMGWHAAQGMKSYLS